MIATKCTSCGEGNSKIGTSGLCEACPDGNFATFGGSCFACPDSPKCSNDCPFLSSCFLSCPNFYDLETNSCKTTCDGVILEGTEYHGGKFCRGYVNSVVEYYVDSSSAQAVELGNKKYPFKSI